MIPAESFIETTIENYFLDNLYEKYQLNGLPLKDIPVNATQAFDNVELNRIKSESDSIEKVLAEQKGVIFRIEQESVVVKLINDLEVYFPKEILGENKELVYGTPVKYQIKINDKGYRYQVIEKDESKDDNLDKSQEELLSLLDSF